ncbi:MULTISPECIES: hypothetical protein [unclassified Pseudomonas]|uniref:hypothetical protein n=1 Tax=unclassified Pseudomonas TaxID=196821 RepID=UPI000F946AA4|nr:MULTISPECIES: hypothetical protein [unclassified Pseudomonas]
MIINISSPSLVTSSKEADHNLKIFKFMENVREVQQSSSRLIKDVKNEQLSGAGNTSFIKEVAPQLDKLANSLALVGAHKFSLQESNFISSRANIQVLDRMAQIMKSNYDDLKNLSAKH